jgi:hypothetical protein
MQGLPTSACSSRCLCSNRVSYALLHVAGLRRARELLFLGVRFAGTPCIPLALRHETVEGGAGELFVRSVGLAGRERGSRHSADGQYQGNSFHGLLQSECGADDQVTLVWNALKG